MINKVMLSLFSKIFVSIAGIFVYGLLARQLNANDFGIFTFYMSNIPILVLLLSAGLFAISSRSLFTFSNRFYFVKNLFQIFSISTFFWIPLFVLGLFFFIDSQLSILARIAILVSAFCFASLRIFSDYFRAKNNIFNFLLFNSPATGGGVLFWFFFTFYILFSIALNPLIVDDIIILAAFSSLTVLLILILSYYKKIKSFFDYSFANMLFFDNSFKNLLLSSINIMFVQIIFTFNSAYPSWIILYYLSPVEAGYFLALFKLCTFILSPLSIIDITTPQVISRLYHNNSILLQDFISILSFVRFMSGVLIATILFIFSDQFLFLFYGEKFISQSIYLKFMVCSFLPFILFGPTRQILIFTSNEKILSKLDIILTPIFFVFLMIILKTNSLETFIICYGFTNLIREFLYFINVLRCTKLNSLPKFKKSFLKFDFKNVMNK